MKNIIYYFIFILNFSTFCYSENIHNRWEIQPNGSILWSVQKNDSHFDHIEMSGKYISVVLRYGVDKNGAFTLNKSLNFPMLRTIPNNTHATLNRCLNWNPLNLLEINGHSLGSEQVNSISIKGILTVNSFFKINQHKIAIERKFFPSVDKPTFFEIYKITNIDCRDMILEVPNIQSCIETDPTKGVNNKIYKIVSTISEHGTYHLGKGESIELTATNTAYIKGEPIIQFNANDELKSRIENVERWIDQLTFESPDSIINTMFAFSKIRACESIFQTKNGPMHAPGGEAYYAAIWANDQAEYINPYFPFTGYAYGNESALNSFRLFARYMNKEWKPIPSSIIAEGLDIWNGAGDRGDAAMIAYGASRYALARGDKKEAEQLYPLIQWCLEYCRRKINKEGVVESNSDELEGRFPSGEANLNTSCLYYDALKSAAYLNNALFGKKLLTIEYCRRAREMRKNIDKYFAHKIEGYNTYAYYKNNDKLRAWICTPLVMGITERAKGTLEALYSTRLWSNNGLLSQEGSDTYWDRSTLYALRGSFYVGETEKALNFLRYYSEKRLLGEHVPYAIEAWPEGSQRHLSAESGLYGRIITEGIWGIRPIGFRQFLLTPHMPKEWKRMALRRIKAFQSDFDIEINRLKDNKLNIIIKNFGKIIQKKNIKNGQTLRVELQ